MGKGSCEGVRGGLGEQGYGVAIGEWVRVRLGSVEHGSGEGEGQVGRD